MPYYVRPRLIIIFNKIIERRANLHCRPHPIAHEKQLWRASWKGTESNGPFNSFKVVRAGFQEHLVIFFPEIEMSVLVYFVKEERLKPSQRFVATNLKLDTLDF